VLGAAGIGMAVAHVPASAALGFFVCTGAIVAIAVAVLRREGQRSDALSPLALAAVYYLLAFAAGGLYYWYFDPGAFRVDPFELLTTQDAQSLALASLAGLLSLGALTVGYLLTPLKITRDQAPAFPTLSPTAFPVLLALLLLAGWGARLYSLKSGTYFHIAGPEATPVDPRGAWFLTTASLLPLFATALVGSRLYMLQRQTAAPRLAVVFGCLALLEVLWAVPTGARAAVVGLAAMLVVVRYYGAGRLPSKPILAVTTLVLILFFFPFAEQYRATGEYQTSPVDSASETLSAMSERSVNENLDAGIDSTLSRFADVTAVAAVLRADTNLTRFADGETLSWIPEGFVPRAFLEEKYDPGRFGNEFGRSYGFLYPGDFETSIAISQAGELLLNFGWLGLVLGMSVVGAVYRLLSDILGGRRDSPVALAIYGTVAWDLVAGQEVILALGLIGTVKTMLVLWLITLGVATLFRRTGRDRRLTGGQSAPVTDELLQKPA